MGTIMETGIRPVMQRLELHAMEDPSHDAVMAPFAALDGGTGSQLVVLRADERAREAAIFTRICTVPPARRAAVALMLARLNLTYKAVTFGMDEDGDVVLDTHVELSYTNNPEMMVGLAFTRLHTAMLEGGREIVRQLNTAPKRRRTSKMEREVATLIEQFEAQ